MQLIDNTNDLEKLCKILSKSKFIAVDFEFIREKTYYPLLCLIQVASEDNAAIIDPLAKEIDLSSFFELMQNPKVTKVFHSCRQDVEIVVELSKFVPKPLFDTQIAAMVCGFGESIGYERLVKSLLNIELDKTNRLSNWEMRPLDTKQLEYAICDVTHLVKIYQLLLKEMNKKKRGDWIDEEMKLLTKTTTYYTKPEDAWLKIRHRSHNSRVLSNLKALAAWREKRAMEKNTPRQSIVRDEFLVIIASANPQNKEEMIQIRGMRKDVASGRLADEMLETLHNVVVDEKILKELKQENIHSVPALVEMLKMLMKIVSQKHGVVARLIANDTDLNKFAAYKDKDNPILSGWRYEIFGNEALKLRNGELSIQYNPLTKDIEFINHDCPQPEVADH